MQRPDVMWRRWIAILGAAVLIGATGCTGQATLVVPAGETVESYDVFYDTLEPYGRWVLTEDNGWVWTPYPDVVGADFYPYYTGGRWVVVDGEWTWASDWDWGWAPFHYGRWYRDGRHGWAWIPGHAWAPAWVRWHRAGGRVAWRPLPPHGVRHHVPARWVTGVPHHRGRRGAHPWRPEYPRERSGPRPMPPTPRGAPRGGARQHQPARGVHPGR